MNGDRGAIAVFIYFVCIALVALNTGASSVADGAQGSRQVAFVSGGSDFGSDGSSRGAAAENDGLVLFSSKSSARDLESSDGEVIRFSLSVDSAGSVSGYRNYASGGGDPPPMISNDIHGQVDDDGPSGFDHTPEPATFILVGAGLFGLFAARRRES